MAPVYVREDGAVVRRRGQRLLVTRQKEQLLDLPLLHVDQLILMGHVQITSQAVAMLLKREVDVVFLSRGGKFLGRLLHTGSKFAKLRHAQLKQMSREPVTLAIAKQVVLGKLYNQQELLTKYAAAGNGVTRAIDGIGRILGQASKSRNIDSLRGYEGSGGAHYWGAFKALLPNTFGFAGRKYYPPPDPVNAMLSFGYSLLLKDVTAAVQVVGLDPYLGFFHTIDYGRPSLALDMMEEFRPILVDWIVLEMVRQGEITAADFEMTGRPKQPVRLTEGMIDKLIKQYEQQSGKKVPHVLAGGETSYRRVIELQTRRLARLVMGDVRNYEPFLLA